MTPERLAEIDDYQERFPDEVIGELLAYVDELTRQLDDARDIAVRCGAFETWTGTDVETHVER